MGATAQNIQVSYDVGNEFFRLWLDRDMSYTSAMFEGDESLEAAQARKLAYLSAAAGVRPGDSVLDISCGWGANLDYLASRGAGARPWHHPLARADRRDRAETSRT